MEHSLKDFESFINCRKYLPRHGDGDSKELKQPLQ